MELHTEFGHWEIDSVLGKKGENEPIVMTLIERMTPDTASGSKPGITRQKPFRKPCRKRFHSLESVPVRYSKPLLPTMIRFFVEPHTLENREMKVYFTHPYSFWKRGTNECHNRMLRRFLLKGRSITGYSADDILFFGDMINGLPRKILGYRTPESLFEWQLSFVYAI